MRSERMIYIIKIFIHSSSSSINPSRIEEIEDSNEWMNRITHTQGRPVCQYFNRYFYFKHVLQLINHESKNRRFESIESITIIHTQGRPILQRYFTSNMYNVHVFIILHNSFNWRWTFFSSSRKYQICKKEKRQKKKTIRPGLYSIGDSTVQSSFIKSSPSSSSSSSSSSSTKYSK